MPRTWFLNGHFRSNIMRVYWPVLDKICLHLMWILLFSYRMNALLSGYWQVLSFSFIHSIFSGSKRIKPQRSQTKMNSLLSSFGSLSPYISTLPSDIFLFLSLSTHPTPIALALPSGRADRREGWVALPAAVSVNLGPFYCSHSHSPSLSRSIIFKLFFLCSSSL